MEINILRDICSMIYLRFIDWFVVTIIYFFMITAGYGAIVFSYFESDRLFCPYGRIDDIYDIYCSYEYHECNNGYESYLAKFYSVFNFIV